jgi:hypothetical protein
VLYKELAYAEAARGPEDALLFYFAGHGTLRDGQLELLMSDDSVLGIPELKRYLVPHKAQATIIFLDTSFAGNVADGLK